MSEFSFIKNPLTKKWVISAPRRAYRPSIMKGTEHVCPFCPFNEGKEEEYYRIGGVKGDSDWEVRVISNKFPFAPQHELVINTREHNNSFTTFSYEQIQRLFEVYRHRFNENSHLGQVYIFHNHGQKAGESIPHSHTQIVVIPDKVLLEVPRREAIINDEKDGLRTSHFTIVSPKSSAWSDEVWIVPQRKKMTFGEATDDELSDLADTFLRVIRLYNLRYNSDFPFNFYIYPDGDWYIRIIPRVRVLGGFEVGTNVFVNTQNPTETMAFLREHFQTPDVEKIKKEHQAQYHKTV
jgi:UDPglucose--hexose-1-phosphate uridylyltransferase